MSPPAECLGLWQPGHPRVVPLLPVPCQPTDVAACRGRRAHRELLPAHVRPPHPHILHRKRWIQLQLLVDRPVARGPGAGAPHSPRAAAPVSVSATGPPAHRARAGQRPNPRYPLRVMASYKGTTSRPTPGAVTPPIRARGRPSVQPSKHRHAVPAPRRRRAAPRQRGAGRRSRLPHVANRGKRLRPPATRGRCAHPTRTTATSSMHARAPCAPTGAPPLASPSTSANPARTSRPCQGTCPTRPPTPPSAGPVHAAPSNCRVPAASSGVAVVHGGASTLESGTSPCENGDTCAATGDTATGLDDRAGATAPIGRVRGGEEGGHTGRQGVDLHRDGGLGQEEVGVQVVTGHERLARDGAAVRRDEDRHRVAGR